MTALKFNKVKNLPTSGYNVGDVFFVSSEKKIYIRTASGWEKYVCDITTEDIVDGAVTEAKIADGSITGDKFSAGLTLYMNQQFNYLKQVQVKYGEDPSVAIKSFAQRDNKTALYIKLTNGLLVPANTNGETASGLYSYGNTVRKVLFDGTNWSDIEIQNDIIDTAHIKDGAVTSSKLAMGARRPIILTPSTTEVDEETYQKLLSDDVDVVFKTDNLEFMPLIAKDMGNELRLIFGYTLCDASNLQVQNSTCSYVVITVETTYPHKVTVNKSEASLETILNTSGYLNKSTLTPVLKEIDLTGTDADRKAKLDKFETDWKALTGATDLRGARFVGYYSGHSNSRDVVDLIISALLVWDSNEGSYHGLGVDDSGIKRLVYLGTNGNITCANIMEGAFSHLEAITIYTDNTEEHMQANLDNIAAYESNLQALGVDTTKSPMIPCDFQNDSRGWITKSSTASGGDGAHLYTGIARDENGTPYTYFISIDPTGEYSKFDAITSGYINNDFELGVVGVQTNAKSLEAITIKTSNSTTNKADNKAAITAYVNNLKALGVDVTKGYMIPVKLGNGYQGFIMGTDAAGEHTGVIKRTQYNYGGGWIQITTNGTYQYLETLTVGRYSLTTTSKKIVDAINEINALAKGKQDTLTSGTNIKTVNGQSLLGSGDVTVGSDVTAAGDNTFTGNNVFSGIAIADILDGTQYQITGDNGSLMFAKGATNDDIELTGVATPTFSNSAANKKYVDDKVAAAGGGSAPVLIDIDEITGSAGDTISVDIFNTMANAANAKTPVFGYYKLVESTRSTYEIIPLYIKFISNTSSNGSLAAQYIRNNAYNNVVLRKLSDTECSILIASSRTFALATSVDKSSTRGVQSSAVWKEIHAEPMTVNTATSGVTTLSSTDKHKILCYADSGTQQYNLPGSPVDGETFMFLKVKSGHTITIQSGTGSSNVYDCSSGNSVISKTVASSTRRKITVTYSSSVAKWFLMADDFLS